MAYFQQLQGYMDDMNSAQSHESDVQQSEVDKKVGTIQEKFEAVSQQAEGWGGALVGAGQAWKLGRKVYKSIKATNETSASGAEAGTAGTSGTAGTAGTGEIPLSGGFTKVASKATVEGHMAMDDTVPLDNSESLIARGGKAIKSAVSDADGAVSSSGAGATSDALNIAKPLVGESGVDTDLVARLGASALQTGAGGAGGSNVIGDVLAGAKNLATKGLGAGAGGAEDLTANIASRASSVMNNINDLKGALGRGMSAVRNGVSTVRGAVQGGAGAGAGAGEDVGATIGKSILERVGASSFADAVPVIGEVIGIGSLIGGLIHGLHKKGEDAKMAGASAGGGGGIARGAIDIGSIGSNLGGGAGGYVA